MLVTATNNQIEGDVIHAPRPSKRLRGGAGSEIGCVDGIEHGVEHVGRAGGCRGSEDGVDAVDGVDALDAVDGVDAGVVDHVDQGPERAGTPDDVAGLEGGDVCEDGNNPLMYSLERRFLSQQVLETPVGNGNQSLDTMKAMTVVERKEEGVRGEQAVTTAASAGAVADQEDEGCGEEYDEYDECDEPLFRIKSQLTYERANSHSQFSFDEVAKENTRDHTEEGNTKKDRKSTATGGQRGWETPCFEGSGGIGIRCDLGMWRDSSENDLGNIACRFITAEVRTAERGDGGEANEQDRELRSSRLQELQIPSGSQDGNNDSDAENRLTPAVHSADRVQLNNGFFPIFRSKKDCKVVYLIRHGESEFNAACSARGSSWEDPLLFDARLTCKGKAQALTLRNEVLNWDLPGDVVWVTSPLTRAIQTLLHVHPEIEISSNESEDGHQLRCRTASGKLDNVVVLPEVTEKLHTSGDVGRNPRDLSNEFPMLEECFGDLDDGWWYTREGRPNCSYKQLFQSHETKESVTRRVRRFRKWIIDRPEKVFVAVGHSMFWKEFATSVHNGVKQDTLRNCEWRVLHV